jgi:uncharacterized protein
MMTSKTSMLKRLTLAVLTVLVVIQVSFLLLSSLGEAQITSRLELYQTDLLLHATELQAIPGSGLDAESTRKAVLGENPTNTALEQYESVRESAQANLKRLETRLGRVSTTAENLPSSGLATDGTSASAIPQVKEIQATILQQQTSLHQLDLRIGILQAYQNKTAAALETWNQLKTQIQSQASGDRTVLETANILTGLWSDAPRLLPDAEPHLQKNLDGWFRFVALKRLYDLQQRADALAPLQRQEQAIAQQSLVKLAIVGTIPLLGSVLGGILLIGLLIQRVLKGKQALIETNANVRWETPWDWETIAQVLILGFFFIGQFVVPLVLRLVQSQFLPVLSSSGDGLAGRAKAIYALTYYVTMAVAGLMVLYLSVKPFRPLPQGWFRLTSQSNWLLWGVGGYLVALPLMILISLANQQIWQGQGGSNPLLQIVLEEPDPIALAIFFVTAAVAAPIFEETLFRGFLLPSLTRYMPVWGAIAISSLVFAIAHLSLSEVLPLAVLGSILGIVYTRSRSLLSSMLLHSLWNSATMISLLVLGGGAR